MASVAMSGQDTAILNNSVLSDLADGDCITIDFPSEIATVKIGKNQNAIYGFNAQGAMAHVKIRLIRGSDDDKLLNNLLLQQNSVSNFPSTVLLIGEFIKLIGDGQGNVASDTYVLSGGIFKKSIPGKSNVEGDATQSVSEYEIDFASAVRTIT